MHGNVVCANVFLHLLVRPVGQGIDFHRPGIFFDLRTSARDSFCPRRRPVTHASSEASMLFQRPHLAHLAAEHAQRDFPIEEVGAMARHHRLHFPRVGEDGFDRNAVPCRTVSIMA